MSEMAAIVIHRERQLVAQFRRANATSMSRATTLDALGIADRLAFRRLRRHAVIREASPGTFYLDEPSWDALVQGRRRLLLILLVAGLALGGALVAGRMAWPS